jgi:hypothetical protein
MNSFIFEEWVEKRPDLVARWEKKEKANREI